MDMATLPIMKLNSEAKLPVDKPEDKQNMIYIH